MLIIAAFKQPVIIKCFFRRWVGSFAYRERDRNTEA